MCSPFWNTRAQQSQHCHINPSSHLPRSLQTTAACFHPTRRLRNVSNVTVYSWKNQIALLNFHVWCVLRPRIFWVPISEVSMKKTRKLKLLQCNHGVILKHQTFQLNYHIKDAGRLCVVRFGPSPTALPCKPAEISSPRSEGVSNRCCAASRSTIRAWARGWGIAAPSVHIWQKRARRWWAWPRQ